MKPVRLSTLKTLVVLFLVAFAHLTWASSVSIVTVKSPDNAKDSRMDYETALIRLALEKTEIEYGPFHIKSAPAMGVARGLKSLSDNIYTNQVMAYPYKGARSDEMSLDFVRFPIELGILGVRTCFVSEQSKAPFSSITSDKQLKLFVHGQGRSWGDVKILRHNGLKVIEIEKYDNLFRMISAGRFDLFCRGTNEILAEYETHKDEKGIFYDRSVAIRYNFPRFLYFNQKNQELGERLTKGLLTAHKDGSLHALWREEHGKSIDFVDIDNRKVFDLTNPLVDSIDFDYEQYYVEWARKMLEKQEPIPREDKPEGTG